MGRGHRPVRGLPLVLAVAVAPALLLGGCSGMSDRGVPVLLAKKDEPSVELCTSHRTADGGLRLVGRLNTGIYPITGAKLEYRILPASAPPPVIADSRGRSYALATPLGAKVSYKQGSGEIAYAVDARVAARRLPGKVLWYRWRLGYRKGNSQREEVTAIHRTSLEEAGLPRATGAPGPDSSVAPPIPTR